MTQLTQEVRMSGKGLLWSSRTHPERAGHLPAVILQQAQPGPQGQLQAKVRQPAPPAHGPQLQGQVWRGQIEVVRSARPKGPSPRTRTWLDSHGRRPCGDPAHWLSPEPQLPSW